MACNIHGNGCFRGVLRGSVHEILERRADAENPGREKLEVAMPNRVHEIKEEPVEVEHAHASASKRPRPQKRNGEIRSVHQMLGERMHRPCAFHRHRWIFLFTTDNKKTTVSRQRTNWLTNLKQAPWWTTHGDANDTCCKARGDAKHGEASNIWTPLGPYAIVREWVSPVSSRTVESFENLVARRALLLLLVREGLCSHPCSTPQHPH